MKIYSTYHIKEVGSYRISMPGPNIYAVDDVHAKTILRHIGKGDYQLGVFLTVLKNPNAKIELDSLLIPNNLQLN